MLLKSIIFFGQKTHVVCDAHCEKAWGNNNRPKVQLSANDDDYEYLADGELGIAPIDPGTYEGDHAKPRHPDERLNKWCARECERSELVRDLEDFTLTDFSQRVRNIKP